MITLTKPSVSPVKSAATVKVDRVLQVLFNQDIFMCLIDHLTVKECYAMFSGLSKWHHSFLNGERDDSKYLGEWLQTNHGLAALISSHCTPDDRICTWNDRMCGHFAKLVCRLSKKVKKAKLSTDYFSISTMLHYLYDRTLEIPDRKENPEMYSVVKSIRKSRYFMMKALKEECAIIIAQMQLLMNSRTEEFDAMDHPYLHMIEIMRGPLLFGAHPDSLKLRSTVSGMLCKLATKFPRKSLELELVLYEPAREFPKEKHKLSIFEAFAIGFDLYELDATLDNCASGLLQLLVVMQDEPKKTEQILHGNFLETLAVDIKACGCIAFAESLKAFRVFCEHHNPAAFGDIVGKLVGVCEAALTHAARLDQKQFQTIIECVYWIAKKYTKVRVGIFVDSKLFEPISKYIKERRPANPMIPIRVLSVLSLIRKYGTDETFRCILELFPVSDIIKNSMTSGLHTNCERSLLVVSSLPPLLKDAAISVDFFGDVRLVKKLINVGIDSWKGAEKLDLKMAEEVLNCVKSIIRNALPEHVSILITESRVWHFLRIFVKAQREVPKVIECVCELLDQSKTFRGGSIRLSYQKAKSKCEKKGIRKGIRKYCKKESVSWETFPTLIDHFPALGRYLLHD